MGTFRKLMLAGLLVAISGSVTAGDNFWIGAKAGTLGIGVEAAWRPIEWIDVRFGANQYDYDDTGSQAGVNYDGTLGLETFYGTANFRFPLSPFRISVGAFSNSNRIDLVSNDATSVEIGGIVYTANEVGTLRSETTWASTSPYVGAGFDFEVANRVGLSLDFGVLWQGDPDVTLTADGLLANDAVFLSSLESERSELIDEVDALKAYPVISLGINFNF